MVTLVTISEPKGYFLKNRQAIIRASYLLFLNLAILSVILLFLNYLSLLDITLILSTNWLFFIIIASLTIAITSKYNLNLINNKENSFINEIYVIAPYFFLAVLLLLAINQFVKLSFLTNINMPLVTLGIAFGFLTFYKNRDKVERELEDEKTKEDQDEQRRKDEFDIKFPRLKKFDIPYGVKDNWSEGNYVFSILFVLLVPFIFLVRLPYSLVKWMYKEGWAFVLVLFLILVVFVAIKAPYMGLSFTGLHEMKYSSYVEPAMHMLEHGPLWNEKRYQADPVTLVNGTYDTFGNYPAMEWGLYATYKIFPFNSIEFNTRLFMTLIGILTLISAYVFFKIFLPKKQALLVTFLLAINFIFQFFTFVTVMDPVVILLMFSSLILLIGGIEKYNAKKILLSGIIAGVSINLKYDAIILYLPIFIAFTYFYKEIEHTKKISYIILTMPLFLIETLAFRISVRYLPRDLLIFGPIFILVVLAHLFIYLGANRIQEITERIFRTRYSKIIFYIAAVVLPIIIILLSLKIELVNDLFRNFLTDKYLIFNWKMYSTLFGNFKEWATWPIYFLGLMWIFGLHFIKSKKTKLVSLAFLLTSLIYLILASKVIYFHQYYAHIIVFTLILFASNTYLLIKCYNNKLFRIIFIAAFLILIVSLSIGQIRINLSLQNKPVLEVGSYLKNNLNESEFYILSPSSPISIGFYADRKVLYEQYSFPYNDNLTKTFRLDISNGLTLGELAQKYHIKYYVSKNTENSIQSNLIYLYSENLNVIANSFPERTLLILCRENKICPANKVIDQEGSVISKEKIIPYLSLNETIEGYNIYQFHN